MAQLYCFLLLINPSSDGKKDLGCPPRDYFLATFFFSEFEGVLTKWPEKI